MMKDSLKDMSSRAELKEKVIQAAMEAFRKYGIKTIRMDDVANSLKISKRTLYEIFEDKETLLKECILYHQEFNQKAIEKTIRESKNVLEVILKCYKDSIEMYHKTNSKFFEEIKRYPEVYAIISSRIEQDSTVVIDFLKRGVDQGIFREDINFALIHALLYEQKNILMTSNISKQFSFLEVYEAMIFIYLRGIATQKGAQELDDFIREYREERVNIQLNGEIQENEEEN